jgi:dethiobiotin synthetase
VSVLFVTGTDTGAGKTLVSAAITAGLRARGVRVGVAKPCETGCAPVDARDPRARGGALLPEDAATLAGAAGDGEPLETVCPYRFPDPLAPSLAAERAGASIDVARLVETLTARARALDLLLVEGAGGLLVPLTREVSFADLAARLDARVLLVVGSRLGAINHALLSLAALRTRAIPTVGYVVNRLVPEGDLAVETNTVLLRSLTDAPYLGELPFLPEAPALLAALRADAPAATSARARLADLAETHLALTTITTH